MVKFHDKHTFYILKTTTPFNKNSTALCASPTIRGVNYCIALVLINLCMVTTLQRKKIPDFSRRNCRQYVEQMHIY